MSVRRLDGRNPTTGRRVGSAVATKSGSKAPRSRRAAVKQATQALFVGAAGWSIPSRYSSELPGEGSHLERYARRLSAVEINSSFYRHHRAETYARWAASVPKDFRFSVKAPSAFTHEGELRAHAEVLAQFMEETAGLGEKLGVILVQLPPKMEFDAAPVRRFFRALRKRIGVQLVCEPRHPSWGAEKAERLLAELSVARVAADPSRWPGGNEPGGDRSFVYFRWHGQPRKYFSDYGRECLATLEKQIEASEAKQAWAIFDNTAHGYAIENALSLASAAIRPRRKR